MSDFQPNANHSAQKAELAQRRETVDRLRGRIYAMIAACSAEVAELAIIETALQVPPYDEERTKQIIQNDLDLCLGLGMQKPVAADLVNYLMGHMMSVQYATPPADTDGLR